MSAPEEPPGDDDPGTDDTDVPTVTTEGVTPMSTPAPEPTPLILTNASVKIDGTELACLANHVELSPDVNITTLDTFCGSRDYPGTAQEWSLVATFYQSFDAGSTEGRSVGCRRGRRAGGLRRGRRLPARSRSALTIRPGRGRSSRSRTRPSTAMPAMPARSRSSGRWSAASP